MDFPGGWQKCEFLGCYVGRYHGRWSPSRQTTQCQRELLPVDFGCPEASFVQAVVAVEGEGVRPLRDGRQSTHGLPDLTQEQALQRPLPLHRQHAGMLWFSCGLSSSTSVSVVPL